MDTGQYQAKYQNRTFADMENQNARDLANLPNYTAKAKLLSGEYVIKTHPAPRGFADAEVDARIAAIKQRMRALGYCRPYQEVMAEIRQRQERLREHTPSRVPPPGRTNGQRRRRPKPPPAHTKERQT